MEAVRQVAEAAEKEGQNNVAYLAFFALGKMETCLDILIKTKRLPEAAFFAT